MDVPVRDLKNHLSEYLRRAQAGEDIVVTSHGRPVARLSAVAEPPVEDDPEAAAIARLRAQPWVRPGSGRLALSDVTIPWPEGEKPLSQLVIEDRE